ncbi:heme exporter protein CcmB [Pseudaquidulcibacter saccharophilus]|uniref:heme exporter protein CcmB n=1 Tax=Pseudaquidulcibacter saccharophilus TaxID=2831900 RepID=UPI001EFF377D|nr:heme exporter protein CcmB [Pseudaquidulcibacter saccharophilus]
MKELRTFLSIITREVKLNLGTGGGALLPTAFFAGAMLLLPFAVGPDRELLAKIGGGYLWLALALASLVSLERLFQGDIDDGTMEQLSLSGLPFSIAMLGKILGQFVAIILPLLVAMPVAGLMLNIPSEYVMPMTFTLFIGALAMFLLGSVGAALGASVKRGGLLVALLALPLYTPIVIFGSSTAGQIMMGNGVFTQGFFLLSAIVLFAIVLCPLAIAAAIKLNLD